MGEIGASMEPENAGGPEVIGLGLRDESTVCRTTVDGVVDTGADGNRFVIAECVIVQPSSEPLIGQIVLEALGLVADCGR